MTKRPKFQQLNALSDQEIKDAFEYQRVNSIWNFYSEREFLENVLNQKVNFMITVFALFITAAATVHSEKNLVIVFLLGAFLMFIFSFSMRRLHARLIIVLRILYKLEEKHVLPIIQREVDTFKGPASIRTIDLRYKWIPIIFIFIMVLGAAATCIGWIEIGESGGTVIYE